MGIANKDEQHTHEMTRRSYALDGPVTNDTYNLPPRYILFRKCATCEFKKAYDLTTERPNDRTSVQAVPQKTTTKG